MGGGSGTANDPYLICSTTHLLGFQGDLSAQYKLMANLDLSSESSFSPIGAGSSFTGTFDGNGYTISNWTYGDLDQRNPVGLFSVIDSGATIKNLSLTGFSVISSGNSGLLAGTVNSGSILNCSVQGAISMAGVSGQGFVGGLVGSMSSGIISSSSFSGSITAKSDLPQAIGGLVGKGLNYPSLSDSYFSGSIDAGTSLNTEGVGGIVGVTEGGATLRRLYVGGTITGPNVPKGGLVGASDATAPTIVNSYFSTDQTGIGVYPGTLLSAKTNTQLRSQETFDGWDFSGIWTISAGQFPALRAKPSPVPTCKSNAQPFGGGAGTSVSPYLICDVGHLHQVSNHLLATYRLESDLDLTGDSAMVPIGSASGTPFTGKFDGNGYSISNWNPTTVFVSNAGLFSQLGTGAVVQNLSLTNFVLTASSDNVGALAGQAGGAMIQNVNASDLTIQGGWYVGGLVGRISGTKITQVWIAGAVSANLGGGGLVGWAKTGSLIAGVRSEVNVSGNQSVGGLVGLLDDSTIQKSFASGSVTADDSASQAIGGLVGATSGSEARISDSAVGGGVGIKSGGNFIGGLVGRNTSSGLALTKCYVAAPVTGGTRVGGLVVDDGVVTSKLVNSYFDGDLNGIKDGNTTKEMQTQKTFLDWDFDNTWQMPSGSYPLLRW